MSRGVGHPCVTGGGAPNVRCESSPAPSVSSLDLLLGLLQKCLEAWVTPEAIEIRVKPKSYRRDLRAPERKLVLDQVDRLVGVSQVRVDQHEVQEHAVAVERFAGPQFGREFALLNGPLFLSR